MVHFVLFFYQGKPYGLSNTKFLIEYQTSPKG
jgi:hypothetical protein